MTNLFGSLDIVNWGFIVIWCLGFEIYEVLNTRDIISNLKFRHYKKATY